MFFLKKSRICFFILLSFSVSVFAEDSDVGALKLRIAELKAENEGLKEALNEEEEEDLDDGLQKLADEVDDLRSYINRFRRMTVLKNSAALRARVHKNVFLSTGVELRSVKVTSFDDLEIRVAHEGGASKLTHANAPEEWIEKFGLLSEEQAKLLQSSKDPFTEEIDAEDPEPSTFALNGNETEHIVIIEGDASTGTGFLLNIEGRSWLYTAAHVISGNKTLKMKNINGDVFKKFDLMQTAEGFDLLRFRLKENVEEALEVADSSDVAKENMKVAALGNGGGAGVISSEEGIIKGISAEFFEVDCDIIPGNSGGPIILQKTRKVIGVVTHLKKGEANVWTRGTRFTKIRRFGCRLNREHKWVDQSIASFIKEGKDMVTYDKITRLCFALSSLQATTTGMHLGASVDTDNSVSILSILEENEDEAVVKELYEMNGDLSGKKSAVSRSDLVRRYTSILRQALNKARRTKGDLASTSNSSFHGNEMKKSLQWRETAIKSLKSRIDGF